MQVVVIAVLDPSIYRRRFDSTVDDNGSRQNECKTNISAIIRNFQDDAGIRQMRDQVARIVLCTGVLVAGVAAVVFISRSITSPLQNLASR